MYFLFLRNTYAVRSRICDFGLMMLDFFSNKRRKKFKQDKKISHKRKKIKREKKKVPNIRVFLTSETLRLTI